jgi:pantetheine-phosphate adenylyltransferase
MKYKRVAVGGTFDKLHDGHKRLLEEAFTLGEEVYIGLVNSEELLKDKELRERIDSYEVREKRLVEYLKSRNWYKRAYIIPLHDRYGITLAEDLDALIVTPGTITVGEEINKKREKYGLKKLDLIKVDFVLAEDGKIISSTRIRKGEIDGRGRVIKKLYI